MAARVSVDDLTAAAGWLRAMEDDHGVPIGDLDPDDVPDHYADLLRVAAWIDAEIARRTIAAAERTVARRAGMSLNNPTDRQRIRRVVADNLHPDRKETR